MALADRGATDGRAVHEQLHLVGVGVHLDRDRLALEPGPRP